MPFTIVGSEEENGHVWTVATSPCQLEDPNDALVHEVVALVRESYGEGEILQAATEVLTSEITDGIFPTEHLLAAIRKGLPDPSAEGNKPPALTTYRSQSAEMVAKAALAAAYNFAYPSAPQQGVTNPNQPVLGFDGWGLLRASNGGYTLILIQVKATDERACPPREAEKLADECCRIPRDPSAICRALSVFALHLKGDPLQEVILRMLASLGNNVLPEMHVAPAIVRGTSVGHIDDLKPVRERSIEFTPATARGIVVTIGVALADFGVTVMRKARETV